MEQEDVFSCTSIVSPDTDSLSRDQAFDSCSTEVNSTTKNVPLPETTRSGEGTLKETFPHDETRDSKLGDMDLLPCRSPDDDAEQNLRDQPLHTDDEERTPMEDAIREMEQERTKDVPDKKTWLEEQVSTSHEKLGMTCYCIRKEDRRRERKVATPCTVPKQSIHGISCGSRNRETGVAWHGGFHVEALAYI